MSATEQFSLCWDNYHKNMSSGMHSLLESEDLVDVTLAVEGKYLKAHKMVLSVCSPYFRNLFRTTPCQHPIVFMKDVGYDALCDLLQFMYRGEVQVNQENLSTFIKTAEALQIKGLTGDSPPSENDTESHKSDTITKKQFEAAVKQVKTVKKTPGPAPKRPRLLSTPEKVTVVGKPEPPSQDQVQYKLEPYEGQSEQSTSMQKDETCEEVFDDEDDAHADDTEDYGLLETGTEPRAGTSGDCSEGQDAKLEVAVLKRKQDMPRYIVDGFVFHVNIMKGNPPMTYLRCLEYKRLGCHARAVIPSDGTIQDIKINKPHNHPPDYAAEQKIVFLRELKEVMLQNPTVSPRELYTSLSEFYPIAARETPYELIRHKMNRWRRLVLNQSVQSTSSTTGSPSSNVVSTSTY